MAKLNQKEKKQYAMLIRLLHDLIQAGMADDKVRYKEVVAVIKETVSHEV